MEIYDFNALLESGEKRETPMVIAIGVFDGVHKGHQRIFECVRSITAQRSGYESMCITFSSNPKDKNTGNLDTLRLREEYVSSFTINSFTIIDFSENFSKISARAFASAITRLCKPCVLVVGSDFKCGNPKDSADGEGMRKILHSLGYDIDLKLVDFVLSENGEKISSTLLRQLIIKGDLESYSRFSGQDYHLDLLTKPSRLQDDVMEFSREHISQLLPPPGAYEGALVLKNGLTFPIEVSIDSTVISFKCRDDSWQVDSLYITRRKVK